MRQRGANKFRNRYLIHLMVGGLGHGLHYFGNSVSYAAATGRRLVPCFEGNEAFAIPFHDVFDADESVVCSREESEDALEIFSEELGKPGSVRPANLGSVPSQRFQSVPAVDGQAIPYPRTTCLPILPVPLRQVVVTDGELRYTKGNLGKVANAWLDLRVRQPTGLLRGLSVLRVRAEVIERAQTLRPELDANYLGVHFRNTDRKSELDEVVRLCRSTCAEHGLATVYWATDDVSSIARASDLLPEATIRNFARLPTVNEMAGENVHYLSSERLAEVGATKRDRLYDTLGDVFLLARASAFVGHADSALSRMVSFLRSDPELAARFFGYSSTSS